MTPRDDINGPEKPEAKTTHVDLCIIGAGAAGLSIAAGAVQLGLDVALIESGKMGGDCLNTGCVPSKAMLAAAKAAENIRSSEHFGIKSGKPDIDFEAVRNHVNHVIGVIEPHDSQERFEGMGVKVFRERATFLDKKTVKAGDQKITAKNFVIATGSVPVIPAIDGLDPSRTLTNETLFDLDALPEHIAIIGGGPIGIEMAQAHARLGSKITVIDHGPILPRDEPSLVAVIRERLIREGIKLREHTDVKHVQHNDSGITITTNQDGREEVIEATHVLAATGRKTIHEGLGLDQAGIAVKDGKIISDNRLRTSQKHIFVAGDAAGGPQFTHIAGYHAGIIIRNLIFKMPAKTNYDALPWVTYTDPELAHVGMTEKQAREKYGDKINVIKWRFKENDRAQAERETDGAAIAITDKKGRILGASIAGPHAGEIIGLWCLAISEKLKIGAIANMIAPYPTYGEISKRLAGSYYTSSLFSDKTRKIVGLLSRLPI